ncbi:Phosphopantetheine attachment site [Streptomyces sp. DvalAA-14]|nr:AMP-binding protein [Streptomyces sp. SID4948]SCE41506.1 Phosphopantetheine attachment site [Streptomyces sp. DvalAA-14]
MPIDNRAPGARRDFILAETGARLLVTHSGSAAPASPPRLDADLVPAPSGGPTGPLDGAGTADALMYVLYTSGTTGEPKGVMVPHAGVSNLLAWMVHEYGLDASDRILQKTPYTFDASVWELFAPLVAGGTVVMARPGDEREPRRLAETAPAERITGIQLVPTMLRHLLAEPALAGCGALRQVFTGGEALTPALRDAFFERLSLPLHNLYGATETSIQVLTHTCLPRPELEGEELAGLFLNTVPVRAAATADEWAELFAGIFRSEQGLMARRRYPLADILSLAGRGELFDTVFNYTDFHVYRDASHAPVRITGARYFEMTSFPFVVHVHRDHFAGRTSLTVNHDPAAVSEEAVVAYLEAYTEALASAAAGLRPGGPRPTGAGSGELEERLAETVGGSLTSGPIGPDEDYFAHGLDSISAIRVVARIKRQGIPITLQDVFAHRTVRSLAAALTAGTREAVSRETAGEAVAGPAAEVLPPGAEDACPATALQLEMIRRHEADPRQAVYHDVFAYRLAVPLREQRLREVLDTLVAAHPTLRTAFLTDARPVPLQVVHAPAPAWLVVHDPGFGELPEAEAEARFDAWFEAEKASGFTWSRPELMRFHAHRQGPDAFTLTLSFHHSVIDGWSLSRLLAEFVRLYTAGGTVPAPVRPPAGPREYAATEVAARADERSRQFWLAELRGAPAPGFPAPAADGKVRNRWSEAAIEVDAATGRGLAALAHRAGVPLKHMLLAAHLGVLRGLERRPDLLTAVFSGGRPEVEGAEDMIGMFLNFLPLRVRLEERPQWQTLAAQVFEAERRALPHRRFPVAELYAPDGPAAPRTAFNFTRFEAYGDLAADGTADGMRVLAGIRWFEHTHFALLANVGHDLRQKRLIITLNADGRVLPPDAVREIGRAWQDVLSDIAAESGAYHGS